MAQMLIPYPAATTNDSQTEIVTLDKKGPAPISETENGTKVNLFSIPRGFENRVSFWVDIYSKYSDKDAVFHDEQNLSRVYKVVDLRPIMDSQLHPFVKEARTKKLIEKERRQLLAQLQSLKQNLGKGELKDRNQELFEILGKPTSRSEVSRAMENLRMQIGQKNFVEKAMLISDQYLPIMEQIFEKKGLPKELTRMPFVESSFNLAAKSRVGASGIWQIMPATGRKLMAHPHVDYRNDPIGATEFAASLLKFNYKVTDTWPLAITAYNHGPTSMVRLSKKFKTNDLATMIERAYGTHAFGFASSNFYACFLAILEIEKNRDKYFPTLPRSGPLEYSKIQLKKPIQYKQLLGWFSADRDRTEQFNPHLSSAIKRGQTSIPTGTILYVPAIKTELAGKAVAVVARQI
jgi:membrane-bound lytic murein transglycosylase D